MFLLHRIVAWPQLPSFTFPGLRAAAPLHQCRSNCSRAARAARAEGLPQFRRRGLGCSMCSLSEPRQHILYPDSQPGPRLRHPQHPTGTGSDQDCSAPLVCQTLVKTLLASVCCCLPLGKHNTAAATRERAEWEQRCPTSPPGASSLLGKMAINVKSTTNG